jgi:hypothetical protein
VRITDLTFLAFYLNGAIDTGKYSNITCEQVREAIETRTVFDFLDSHLGMDIDLSIFSAERRKELEEEWNDMLAIRARKKFGVENNGLCLLVAFCLEGIQQRQDKNPPL